MAHLLIPICLSLLIFPKHKKEIPGKEIRNSSNTTENQYLFLAYLFNYYVKVSTLRFEDNIAMNKDSVILILFISEFLHRAILLCKLSIYAAIYVSIYAANYSKNSQAV